MYPVRVGVPGLLATEPPVVVEPLDIADPPWVLYEITSEFAVHFANAVTEELGE